MELQCLKRALNRPVFRGPKMLVLEVLWGPEGRVFKAEAEGYLRHIGEPRRALGNTAGSLGKS